MIVYTVLFTLPNKKPEENRYVELFKIWFTFLLKNGGLKESDKIVIIVDTETLHHLQTQIIPSFYRKLSNIHFHCIPVPQPQNLTEGMLLRYTNMAGNYGDTLLYLDLDILVVKSLQYDIPLLHPNQLMVMPEGKMAHPLYAANLVNADEIRDMCGFSSGSFAFCYGEGIQEFFNKIKQEALEIKDNPRYTVDQPFFNKWLFLTINTSALPIHIMLMRYNMIEQNVYEVKEETVLINYAGDPGVDSSHYQKVLTMLCIEYFSSAAP